MGDIPARFLSCEEFFLGLDGASLPAENGGIRCLDIPEEILDPADRLHAPVHDLAVEGGELGGIALQYEHPAANGAYCPTNNFHELPQGYDSLN